MGVCYEQGLGVQQNLAEALRHYRQSAAAGNRQARERLRAWEQELQGTGAAGHQGLWDCLGERPRESGACIARGGVTQGHGTKEFFVLKGRLHFSFSVLSTS